MINLTNKNSSAQNFSYSYQYGHMSKNGNHNTVSYKLSNGQILILWGNKVGSQMILNRLILNSDLTIFENIKQTPIPFSSSFQYLPIFHYNENSSRIICVTCNGAVLNISNFDINLSDKKELTNFVNCTKTVQNDNIEISIKKTYDNSGNELLFINGNFRMTTSGSLTCYGGFYNPISNSKIGGTKTLCTLPYLQINNNYQFLEGINGISNSVCYNDFLNTGSKNNFISVFINGEIQNFVAPFTSILNPLILSSTQSSILFVKGYTGKIYCLYINSDLSIKYKLFDSISLTFGNEKTLFQYSGSSPSFKSIDSCEQHRFFKIGNNKIIIPLMYGTSQNTVEIVEDLISESLTISRNSITSFPRRIFSNNGELKNPNGICCEISSSTETNGFLSFLDLNSLSIQGTTQISNTNSNQDNGIFRNSENPQGDILDLGNNKYLRTLSSNVVGQTQGGFNTFLQLVNQSVIYVSSKLTSIDFITSGMKSFLYTSNKILPLGTSISLKYSIDSGVSWNSFNEGETVPVVSNKLRIEITLNPTLSSTPIIDDYTLQINKE